MIFEPPAGDWIAVSSSWSQTSGQPSAWLHDFEYDKITIDVDGSTATLVGRVTTDATLYGERKKWRLQLRQSFIRTGGKWIATRSVGTTW